jgi:peptidylprolyl isomerase
MAGAADGNKVSFHYTGTLNDGTTFDSSRGREPMEFELGAGQIIPGLEREMVGMDVGETKRITVAAADAYGPHRPEAVQTVERAAIPAEIDLEEGLELQATDPSGRPMRLKVVDVADDQVTLDANHPLAGEDLTFDVEIVAIG